MPLWSKRARLASSATSVLPATRIRTFICTCWKWPRQHGFHFDTAQMPLNVMDAHFRSFGKLVVPELVKEKIGVLGMKPMANGIILRSKTVTPIECLHYALNLPTSVVITGIDSMEILDQAFEAVRTFHPIRQTRS